MNNVYLLSLLIPLAHTSVFAADMPSLQMGIKGLHSVYDTSSQEKDAIGLEGWLGLEWHALQAEVGMGSFAMGQDESVNPFFFRAKYAFDIAPNTQLYAGGGGAVLSGTLRPLMSVGLTYQMTPSFAVDAGYQLLMNPPSLEGDMAMFGLGIVYRPQTVALEEIPMEDSGRYLSPAPTASTPKVIPEPVCETVNKTHTVKTGEYLIRIADRYHVSLAQLLSWNEQRFLGQNINLIYPEEQLNYQISICK